MKSITSGKLPKAFIETEARHIGVSLHPLQKVLPALAGSEAKSYSSARLVAGETPNA
jgi:hypothetical protein